MILNKKLLITVSLIFLELSLWSVEFGIAFIPYQGATKKIVTENFIILFPEDYKEIAQKTANYCEDVHIKLVPFMNWKPYEKTTVVLSDHTDYPNGIGFPFFRNTMVLYLSPFDTEISMQDIQNPLYSLIVHEYTHVLHLDQIRQGAFFWRVLYGKLYSPNSGSFGWYTEGTAVLTESMLSSNGRLKSVYNDAIIRNDVLKNDLANFDEIIGITENAYQYGARFINYLYTTYGREKFEMFYTDISNDFWPFILQFVFKFKKIYKKPLKVLWNEWRDYETENAKKYYETKKERIKESKKLTNLGGDIYGFSKYNEFIYFSNSSTNNDKYLYKYDTKNSKLKKIKYGFFNSVSATDNEDYILYTKPANYIGGFYYYDLYCFNQKTRFEKKLTQQKRVTLVSFSPKNETGVFVSNRSTGTEIFKARFKDGDLFDINKIEIPEDILYIDQPSINDDGDMVVFSARNKSGYFRLYLLDLITSELIQLNENIIVKNVKWTDDHSVSFVAPDSDHSTNSFYICDLNTMEISKAAETAGCIYNGLVIEDKAYFVDLTYTGMHLFETDLSNKSEAAVSDLYYNFEKNIKEIITDKKEYQIKNYYGMRGLYPTIWGFLPYQLSSSLNYTINNYVFSVPFMMIAPQFFLYNITPLGRFTYIATVGFNYMKFYPDNTLSFRLLLPYLNIIYEWINWKGGSKYFLDNKIHSYNYYGQYPINFKNELTLYYSYRIWGYNSLGWQAQLVHNFYQYDLFNETTANYGDIGNKMGFYLTANYSYIAKRNRSTRWDRGMAAKLTFHFYPGYVLDNYAVYMLKGTVDFRIPFYKTFFFLYLEGGIDLLNHNNFYVNAETFRWEDSILNERKSIFNVIDTKSFQGGYFEAINPMIGSKFVSADIGFDITLYKKNKYWHFLTMGFKELYLRPYGEFVYLYNDSYYPLKNILFDIACELVTDLFVDYGNIAFSLVFGNTIGYRLTEPYPRWNIYLYFNAGIM